ARLHDRVLVPVLADHYGRVLAEGTLVVAREGARFVARYHDHALPLSPRSLDALLAPAAARCGSDELAYLAGAFAALPVATAADDGDRARRERDARVLKRALARLLAERADAAAAVDAEIA